MFKPQTIISILRVLSALCLVLGGVATLILIFYCFENADAGIPMVIGAVMITVFGSITYSAMAILMEAIDSIARTNKIIAETLESQNNSTARTAKSYDNSLPPM